MRLSLILILVLINLKGYTQSWEKVCNNPDYYYGEGFGSTLDEASNQALAMLIQSISTTVTIDIIDSSTSFTNNGKVTNNENTRRAFIKSFSQATIDNTHSVTLAPPPNAHVGRWIKKSEINKIFSGRADKIKEMVYAAEEALDEGKVDVALRNYYWAYSLLKSIPKSNDVKIGQHVLSVWIPSCIDEVLRDIEVVTAKRDDSDVELYFTYKGKPVNSLDFVYSDGGFWSTLCSAKDGYGLIQLSQGANHSQYNIAIEIEYRGQSELDPEVRSIMAILPEANWQKAFKTVNGETKEIPVKQLEQTETHSFTTIDPQAFQRPEEKADNEIYQQRINKVINAIRTKQYSTADDCFTPQAKDWYRQLVRYGNATIVSEPVLSFIEVGNNVYCRGLKLSFAFKGNARRTFVEDIVFDLDKSATITNISFGLGATAEDNILGNTAIPQKARMELLSFIQNYQTAYALKRIDFLKSVFDEEAIIITGQMLTKTGKVSLENGKIDVGGKVVYTRHTKDEFIQRLHTQFQNKKFINLRFNKTRVQKAVTGGELYGIELEQDYYSSNYCDHGYLFLELNLNNPEQPMILIRTWQPEPDPDFGTFNMSMFNSYN